MATKLITKVTYKLVTTDANGKETRQQMVKKEYEYNAFPIANFAAFEALADATLNNSAPE